LPCFPLKWRAYEFFPGETGQHPRRSGVTLTCETLSNNNIVPNSLVFISWVKYCV